MKSIKLEYKSKILMFIFSLILTFNNTKLVYAITESDVEKAINESGKVAVTGNLFIWFICAFAFLKVSQKVDSYMSSLGLNVGHTGGSLLGDLVATGRGLAMANGVLSGKGFTDGNFNGGFGKSSTQTDTNFLQGGLAGAVGRKFDSASKNLASDKGSNSLVSPLFNKSMKNNGNFANNGISAIAKGDIKKDGMITGEKANSAFNSYFSNSLNNSDNSIQQNSNGSGSVSKLSNLNSSNVVASNNSNISSQALINSPMDTNVSAFSNDFESIDQSNNLSNMQSVNTELTPKQDFSNNQISNSTNSLENINSSSVNNQQTSTLPINNTTISANETSTIPINRQEMEHATTSDQSVPIQSLNTRNTETLNGVTQTENSSISNFNNSVPQNTENVSIPTYSNLEIGGGHITGTETSEVYPQGVNFIMYNSEQYTKPTGDYTTVTSNDNTMWYKQYETKVEVKTPYEKSDGQIGYTSKLVDKLPEPPKRKDRL